MGAILGGAACVVMGAILAVCIVGLGIVFFVFGIPLFVDIVRVMWNFENIYKD